MENNGTAKRDQNQRRDKRRKVNENAGKSRKTNAKQRNNKGKSKKPINTLRKLKEYHLNRQWKTRKTKKNLKHQTSIKKSAGTPIKTLTMKDGNP